MKYIVTLCALLSLIFVTGCGAPTEQSTDTPTVSPTETIALAPVATNPSLVTAETEKNEKCDVENYVMRGWFVDKLNTIDYWYVDDAPKLADADAVNAWINQFEASNGGTRTDWQECNMYNYVREFNISKEAFRSATEEYIAVLESIGEPPRFTLEDINALYDLSKEEVYQYYLSPFAVLKDTTAYPPDWLMNHTAGEWKIAGLPKEATAQVVAKIVAETESFKLSEEQKADLQQKLTAFMAMQ